jgi:imidazole glycerol phosphate synthase subunit HisF
MDHVKVVPCLDMKGGRVVKGVNSVNLSALYPKGSEEERLVDAMLLAVPR